MISVTFDVWACDGIPASYLPHLPSAYFSQPVPHSALASRQLSSSSLNAACLCTMGSLDTELSTCFSCHCMEFDWRVYYEDVYTCSKCKDLDCFESQRNAFLKLYHHLTSILLLPLSLPYLFDYLYPLSLRHKLTRIQRQRAVQFFILGS